MKAQIIFLAIAIQLITIGSAKAQETLSTEVLELRLQLLEAKLKLIEPKIEELGTMSESLYKDYFLINSILKSKSDSLMKLAETTPKKISEKKSESYNFKSSIQLNPIRLFGGNFQISYEKAIKSNLSLEIAAMGTYVTKNGLGGGYMQNQDLEAYNSLSHSYVSYSGQMFTGYGVIFRCKNYLLNKMNENKKAPLGLYAGPQLMYRKVQIKGARYPYYEFAPNQIEVTQNLNVFAGGLIIGGKFVALKVFSIDFYVGGLMRLSKYYNEKGFTKYKSWNNIDYSGVLPTAGINIGILK
ncbi:MAG: hypothetical protein K9J13_13245 [Saprospiraceae bacterium]|nr:hypothetical protein [Saprospiraceae bacterium]